MSFTDTTALPAHHAQSLPFAIPFQAQEACAASSYTHAVETHIPTAFAHSVTVRFDTIFQSWFLLTRRHGLPIRTDPSFQPALEACNASCLARAFSTHIPIHITHSARFFGTISTRLRISFTRIHGLRNTLRATGVPSRP